MTNTTEDRNKTFYPDNIRIIWDCIIVILSLMVAIQTPLIIVFSINVNLWIALFSILVTVAYLIDIFVNFNMGYFQKGIYVNDKRKIRNKYLKGKFIIDLISAIPFELISLFFQPSSFLIVFTILKLIRLLKIVRIVALVRYVQSKNILNPSILHMIVLLSGILLAAHFISCGWIALGTYSLDLSEPENYLRAFYWTMTTLTTIGYGDITPKTNVQIIYTIFIQLTGAGVYGFVIGNIANLISNIDIAKAQYRDRMEKINNFMSYRNIPGSLQYKVHNYYNYLWESRKGFDESFVLSQLPLSLKTEVSLFLNKEIIQKVPIFKGASPSLIKQIILNLNPMIFAPGDYIVTKGDIGNEMYFISKGVVEVVSENGKTVYATLTDGHFFG